MFDCAGPANIILSCFAHRSNWSLFPHIYGIDQTIFFPPTAGFFIICSSLMPTQPNILRIVPPPSIAIQTGSRANCLHHFIDSIESANRAFLGENHFDLLE